MNRRLTAAIGAVVLAAGCTTAPAPAPRAVDAPAPARYAYLTYLPPQAKYQRPTGEFGVARGAATVARDPRQGGQLFVTDDGAHIVARLFDGVHDHLNIYDVDGGEFRRSTFTLPPYTQAWPGGGSTIVWWDRPGVIMAVDLADPNAEPAVRHTVELPAIPSGDGDTYIKAASDGTLLLARYPRGSGPQTLYLLGPDGAVRDLGTGIGGGAISEAQFSPDGMRLAYTGLRYAPDRRPGEVNSCFHNPVGVLDLSTGQTRAGDVFGAPGDDQETYVQALWWSSDGVLHASARRAACGPHGERTDVGPFREWIRTGGWQQAGDDPVLRRLELADGAQALLLSDGGGDETGTLYHLGSDGRRVQVAEHVRELR